MMNEKTFLEIVKKFVLAKDRNQQTLNMHSLLIKRDDEVYLHYFNEQKKMSDIRSISKTVLTLVTGMVIKQAQEGKYPSFHEHTYIYPFIKDKFVVKNRRNIPFLKQIQVKHLLNHTIGYDQVLLMRQNIMDMDPYTYVDILINEPIQYRPGEHYLYSNAGFYLLSVVLQEFLQEDLLTFIRRELFSPLQMKHYKWEKYGNYLAGATRLWLYPEDLLKIGELLLKQGTFNGQQFIPEKWIEKMTTPTIYPTNVDTPDRLFRRFAYGYGIWLAKEKGIYFGHGTDGQTLVIIPDQNMIIITLAEQKDMEPIEKIINKIIMDVYSTATIYENKNK